MLTRQYISIPPEQIAFDLQHLYTTLEHALDSAVVCFLREHASDGFT